MCVFVYGCHFFWLNVTFMCRTHKAGMYCVYWDTLYVALSSLTFLYQVCCLVWLDILIRYSFYLNCKVFVISIISCFILKTKMYLSRSDKFTRYSKHKLVSLKALKFERKIELEFLFHKYIFVTAENEVRHLRC